MTTLNHIFHDVDRDGWGASAMLVTQLGPETCRLYPTARKNGLGFFEGLNVSKGDTVWVLDVPTPSSWEKLPRWQDVSINWVDHHPVQATDAPPAHVRLYLPKMSKRTTTMHLLVEHDLVPHLERPMEFVRTLCVPGFETRWTRVFDGLSSFAIRRRQGYGGQAAAADTREQQVTALVLSHALEDGPLPAELAPLEHRSYTIQKEVDSILDISEAELREQIVIVRLTDAKRIPLKHFSLRAQGRHHRPVSILVHRKRRLYCGLAPQGAPDLDLLAHFRARGFQGKGHGHVMYVDIPETQIEQELTVLVEAIEDAIAKRDFFCKPMHS